MVLKYTVMIYFPYFQDNIQKLAKNELARSNKNFQNATFGERSTAFLVVSFAVLSSIIPIYKFNIRPIISCTLSLCIQSDLVNPDVASPNIQ